MSQALINRRSEFDLSNPDATVKVSGISFPEPFGRWTDGEFSQITLLVEGIALPYILVMIEFAPFLDPKHVPIQQVSIEVTGAEKQYWKIQNTAFRTRVLVVERAALPDPKYITIDFHIPSCAQPSALGRNADRRYLGLLIRRITIEGLAERPGQDSPLWMLGSRNVGEEAAKSWDRRLLSGFWSRYITGPRVLDIGFRGDHTGTEPIVDGAIGIDIGYPGYDGRTLPFPDGSQDAVYSSHCLEHIPDHLHAIQDWYRVIKTGGHIITVVPSSHLYERKRRPPSVLNPEHVRFYTPSTLFAEFEAALPANTYRVRFMEENDEGYDYRIAPPHHPKGCYEIVLAIQKIEPPAWGLGE